MEFEAEGVSRSGRRASGSSASLAEVKQDLGIFCYSFLTSGDRTPSEPSLVVTLQLGLTGKLLGNRWAAENEQHVPLHVAHVFLAKERQEERSQPCQPFLVNQLREITWSAPRDHLHLSRSISQTRISQRS